MLRKVFAVAVAATAALTLSACDFTATGNVECHTRDDGKYVCTGESVATPEETTTPPTTDPPPTDDPPPVEGVAATMHTGAVDGKVRVWWETARTDVTGWYIERDGTDTSGYGTWGTDLPVEKTDVTFDLLRNGDEYTFTLKAHTASGDLPPVTIKATPSGAVVPPGDDNPPAGGSGDTAAENQGWGTPIQQGSDEFNGTEVDASKWSEPGECWPANDTVKAGRCASHNSVQDGFLRETGTPDGKTGWVASKYGQKYGRWEVRARVITEQPGKAFHPVLITWPDSDAFPQGGEYDYLELNSDSKHLEAFMHHPANSVVQTHYDGPAVDLSQWHNYGFEWSPQGLTGYIDGQQWFHHDKSGFSAPGPMHQTIQLDNFVGTSGMATVHFDADWARAYSWSQPR